MPVMHLQFLVHKLKKAQLSTNVSTLRSQETELQTQLLTLHQENARLNELLHQIRRASEFRDVKKYWISAAITGVEIRTQSRSV